MRRPVLITIVSALSIFGSGHLAAQGRSTATITQSGPEGTSTVTRSTSGSQTIVRRSGSNSATVVQGTSIDLPRIGGVAGGSAQEMFDELQDDAEAAVAGGVRRGVEPLTDEDVVVSAPTVIPVPTPRPDRGSESRARADDANATVYSAARDSSAEARRVVENDAVERIEEMEQRVYARTGIHLSASRKLQTMLDEALD